MSEIGKKKVSFVKWLMKKGVPLEKAKLICYRKFYKQIKQEEREKNYKNKG